MDIIDNLAGQDKILPKKDQTHLLISSVIILISFAVAIGIYFWTVSTFSKNYHPLLSEDKEFYFAISPNSSMLSETDTLFAILSQLTGEPLEYMKPLFSTFAETSGDQIGVFREEGVTYWFTRNSDTSSVGESITLLPDSDPVTLLVTQIMVEDSQYVVVGKQEYQPEEVIKKPSKGLLRSKKDLSSQEQSSGNILYLTFIREEQPVSVLGSIQKNEKVVEVFLMLDSEYQTPGFESKIVNDAIFSIQNFSIEAQLPFIPAVQSISDSSFEVTKLLQQGRFELFAGTIEEFFSNPYAENLIWKWSGAGEGRENIKESVLTDLSYQFPQSAEKELPDGSTIFELQRSKEAFMPTSNNEGEGGEIFTYPLGQLILTQEGGNPALLKGEMPETTESVDNFCVLPQSSVFGHAKSEALSSDLWKRVLFSYNKQNLAICFER